MKAAVLHAAHTPLVIEDVQLDTNLQANAVLVRVTHAGVCHSDYHIMSGDVPARIDGDPFNNYLVAKRE